MAGPHGELVFAPLGGVGEIGMNLSIYGLGDERRRTWLAVDRRRLVRPGGEPAGHRPDPARHPLSRRGAPQPRRHRAHPRPRGPLRRDARPVAAAEGAGLCDAVHRGAARRQARRASPARRKSRSPRWRSARASTSARSTSSLFRSPIRSRNRTRSSCARRLGNVLHTGDWKLDPTPVLGPPTDEAKLRALGAEGCLALIGDSTNAVREGRSPSETDVAKTLAELIVKRAAAASRSPPSPPTSRASAPSPTPRAQAEREVVVVGRAMDRVIAGRARDRLSRRRADVPRHGRLRPPAARQGGGALHRQPGRAARGAGAHRRRTSIPRWRCRRATA